MVDIIGYLRNVVSRDENGEANSNRYIYLRGDDRFLAGSRFQPIKGRIDMNYTALVDSIYEAIDKTVESDGTEVTNDVNPFAKKSFEEIMDEARALWTEGIKKEKKDEILAILEKVFGKPTKFSDIKESDIDKLEEVVTQIGDII